MFRYGIGITDKPQVVESTLRTLNNNCFVITLEEQGSIFNLQLPNFTKGTILLPPPTAEIAAIDGDENKFTQLYFIHLCDLSSLEFLSLIFYTAYYSMPVLLYVPTDSAYVIKFIIDFISFNFGFKITEDSLSITTAIDQNVFITGMSNILATFYVFNFIDINVFINEYRQISRGFSVTLASIYDIVIDKIALETGFKDNGSYITRDELMNAKISHFLSILNSPTNVIPFTMVGDGLC